MEMGIVLPVINWISYNKKCIEWRKENEDTYDAATGDIILGKEPENHYHQC